MFKNHVQKRPPRQSAVVEISVGSNREQSWNETRDNAGKFTLPELENGNVLLKRPDGGVKVEDYSSVTEPFTPAFSTNQLCRIKWRHLCETR